MTDRRSFLHGAGLGAAALFAGRVDKAAAKSDTRPTAPSQQDDGLTIRTVAESEKLHGLRYTEAERRALVPMLGAQVASVRAVRAVPRPLSLQPAIVFDPRLPGAEYPRQGDRQIWSKDEPAALPPAEADVAYASIGEQAHWLSTGQLSSRRLTEIYLERIERHAPQLFCYITVTPDLALRQAAAADQEMAAGRYRGPLHGIPYGIKDVFDTAGIATTWGAEPFRDQVPSTDARIVRMLREAGAVLLGKLATGALANGAEWFGGTCRNPWNTDEPAGGSSTGPGSATAAALCSFSIGTDSLGSILNPADRCGIVGLRATFGRIPTEGAMPLTPSLDRIGPLTRRVEDAALVLAAINAADPTSATSIDVGFDYDATLDLTRLKVGYSKAWFERIGFSPEASVPVSEAQHTALRVLGELGVELVEVELPTYPYLGLLNNLYVEAATVYEALTIDGRDEGLPEGGGFGWPNGWRRAHLMSAVDYLQAERVRRLMMQDFDTLYRQVDAVFGPTYGSFDLLAAMNYTGHPGLTLRAGLSKSPTRDIGPTAIADRTEHTITQNVAFHGGLFEEGKLLALGRALEARLDVWHHRPPIG